MVHRLHRQGLCILAALGLVCSFPDASPAGEDRWRLVPEQEGRRQLVISDQTGLLSWRLRIPERMFADEGMLVGHDIREVYSPVQWERDQEGLRFRRANGMDFPGGRSRLPVEYAVQIRPAPHGLDLSMTVKNSGPSLLHNVVGHICLGHLSEPFRDPHFERTYILSGGSFLNLKETGRGENPIRARYGVQGRRSIRFFDDTRNPFWGPLSPERADNGLILTRSRSGDQLVAFWFEPAGEVFQNSDERNMCIHSDPAFGDLSPGDSATVEGRIIIFQGDLAAFQERHLR